MLTIGAFAQKGGVTARMLRHYDKLGLLCPAHVAQHNGYRYYDEAQLATLAQVETLKRYGFSLAEIAGLLPLPQPQLAVRVHARRLKAYEELAALRKALRRMEDDIMEMEGTGLLMDKYHVIVMEAPPQKVFGLRRTINVSETHALFQDLKAEMAKRGLKRTGVTQLLYHGQDFSYDSMDVEAQAEVAQDGDGVYTLPGGQFAAVTHTGPYETIKYAYEALGSWMRQHPEYRVRGPAVERYLKDEEMAASPEELETGVLFPVQAV
ncbi:MAG: MerR family transcriptional regulator [Ruminococcaceae bacterium]|nr:MerR family transcriptional regulator [Oscillospiraceae bacterium]